MSIINSKGIQNFLFASAFIIFLSSCSSMNVTEERVYDGGIKTVEASVVEVKDLDYETKAIFANATVFFEFDSYNLTSKSIQTLKSVVSVMNANIELKIILAGHADERGTREYNLALGQRRAESVRNYFLLNGITPSRISVKSYGLAPHDFNAFRSFIEDTPPDAIIGIWTAFANAAVASMLGPCMAPSRFISV